MRLAELSPESITLEQRVSQFDLTLMMADVRDELAGSLQYSTDLFDSATMTRRKRWFLWAAVTATIRAHSHQFV